MKSELKLREQRQSTEYKQEEAQPDHVEERDLTEISKRRGSIEIVEFDDDQQRMLSITGAGALTPFDEVTLPQQTPDIYNKLQHEETSAPKTTELQLKMQSSDEQKTETFLPSLISEFQINESVEQRYRGIQQKFLSKARKMIGDIDKSDLSRKFRQRHEEL